MIQEITISNFKCFEEDQTFKLNDINVFTGLNGRGKSSVLQTILLISQSFTDKGSLENIRTANGKFVNLGSFEDIVNLGTSKNEIFLSIKTDDDSENKIGITIVRNQENKDIADIQSLQIDGQEMVDEKSGSNDDTCEAVSIKSIGVNSTVAGLQQFKKVFYVAADRIGPTNTMPLISGTTINSIGVRGENLFNFFADNQDVTNQLALDASEILLGASLRAEKNVTSVDLYIDSADNSRGFKPVNVGFGYSYILPVLTTLIGVPERSIVIVENPEAHLHPGAVSRLTQKIVEYSKKKHLQVFLETHSDHVVNALRVAVKKKVGDIDRKEVSIIHFSREERTNQPPIISQIKIDAEGNLSDYPSDFMDEWMKQMTELV